MLAVALALALLGQPTRTSTVWLGKARVVGQRIVPFLGRVEAVTTSYVIAEVLEQGADHVRLRQRTCRIELANPLGVELSLLPGAAERLPPVELRFARARDGAWYEPPETSGWTEDDVDRDGQPGMTLQVRAPICGGRIFAGLLTTSRARARREAHGGLAGELRVRLQQKVLDTDGACLSVLLRDTDERAEGRFSYVPAAPGATCAGVKAWPELDSSR